MKTEGHKGPSAHIVKRQTPDASGVHGNVDAKGPAPKNAEGTELPPQAPAASGAAPEISKRQADTIGAEKDLPAGAPLKSSVPLALRVRGDTTLRPMTPSEEVERLDALLGWARKKGAGRSELKESGDLFAKPLQQLVATLEGDAVMAHVASDPFLAPLHEQLLMTLRHVRMDAPGGRCAFEPSLAGLQNARDFFKVLAVEGSVTPTVPAAAANLQVELKRLQDADTLTAKKIIAEPLKHYQEYAARITAGGENVKFPEFDNVVKVLELKISEPSILEACARSPHLAQLREIAMAGLKDVEQAGCPYRKTIDGMQRVVAFFDVYERGRPGGMSSPLYHSRRWQYHAHIMKAEAPKHILFPTQYPLGVTDLMKVRGVPLGLTGVVTEAHYADAFYQSPLEFWYHDINHSRRMWQQFTDRAQELGLTVEEYTQVSNDFVQKQLIPMVDFKKGDPEEEKNIRRLMKVILFEVIHEDALPADKELLAWAVGRRPFEEGKFVFETLSADQSSISYARAPNAAVAAIVYRKLEGEFYDMEGMRIQGLGGDDVRTREMVAKAALRMNEALGLGIDPMLLKANVLDDSGLPLDLRAKLIKRHHDKPDRTKPLVEDAAMRDWVRCGERRGSVPFFVGNGTQAPPAQYPVLGNSLEPLRNFLGDQQFDKVAAPLSQAVEQLLAGDPSGVEALKKSDVPGLRVAGNRLDTLAGNGTKTSWSNLAPEQKKAAVQTNLWSLTQLQVSGIARMPFDKPLSTEGTASLLRGGSDVDGAKLGELRHLPVLKDIHAVWATDAYPGFEGLAQKSGDILKSNAPLAALHEQGFVPVGKSSEGTFFRNGDGRFAASVGGQPVVVGIGDVRFEAKA